MRDKEDIPLMKSESGVIHVLKSRMYSHSSGKHWTACGHNKGKPDIEGSIDFIKERNEDLCKACMNTIYVKRMFPENWVDMR